MLRPGSGLGMDNFSTENVKKTSTWLRFSVMIFFGFAFYIVSSLTFFVAAVQFLIKLFTGSVNNQLSLFGASLGSYTKEIISFLTFYTEDYAFPFGNAWPSGVPKKIIESESKPKQKTLKKPASKVRRKTVNNTAKTATNKQVSRTPKA